MANTLSSSVEISDRQGQRLRWSTIGLVLASIPMLAFLITPIIALIMRVDPAAIGVNLANQEVGQAIWLSIITTAASTILGLLLGTPVAYLLARHRFRGRNILDTLIDLPMVLPPSVAGIALLIAFGRRGMIGTCLLYTSDAADE